MTLHAGELVTLSVFDAVDPVLGPLDDTNVDHVSVIVYDSDNVEVMAETDATWNATKSKWQVQWESPAGAPGAYKYVGLIYGVGAGPAAMEPAVFYLARSPVPVPA